jgi:hypothetical protein
VNTCLLFRLTGPRFIQGNTSSTGFGDKIRELTLGESGSSALSKKKIVEQLQFYSRL